MGDPARREATYDDVLAAPEHLVAELIDGELHLHPRPAKPHAMAASAAPFDAPPRQNPGSGAICAP